MTYDKLITGCVRAGQVDTACQLVEAAYGLTSRALYARSTGGLDHGVLERLVDTLSARGLAESHAAPLVQKLRTARVPLPQGMVTATLRGVVKEGSEDRKDACAAAPWRQRRS